MSAREDAVAVIGLAGRFAGAPSIDALWDLLRRGERGITTFTDEELLAAGAPPAHLADPRYVKARGALAGIDLFDAEHFGFLPREAALLDPQQRLLLEHAWEALESAGYASLEARRAGRVSVFASASRSAYEVHVRDRLDADPAARDPFALDGTLVDFSGEPAQLQARSPRPERRRPDRVLELARRRPPRLPEPAHRRVVAGDRRSVVDRRAFHRRRLRPRGRDHLARRLVPRLRRPRRRHRGRRRSGGDRAQAAPEALADGDFIHAVILGTAINNDGAARVGFTAPGVAGQAAVIRDALAAAAITPAEISYVEAHGSGTELGDPIEIAALARAFADDPRRGACPVGSIKASVGHTDVVAGLAGLIKTILCLRARTLVPTVGFERPSPRISFEETPFFVQAALAPWPSEARAAPASARSGWAAPTRTRCSKRRRRPRRRSPACPGSCWSSRRDPAPRSRR